MRHALAALLMSLVSLAGAAPSAAQMVLPGAVAPTPEGAPVPAEGTAAAPKPRQKRKPAAAGEGQPEAPAKVAPPASLAGQTLYLDGRDSQVSFELRDRALVVSRLSLAGKGADGAACRIDVADLPLATQDRGRPNGVARVGVALPACPVAFDVLSGAVLASAPPGSCAFKAAACTVDPSGLWGPQPAALGPDRAKAIEKERARAEAAMRANFKRLVATTRDRPTITTYARDQAQFSSTREEVCRAYAGETKHGFCSTRLTEARAEALRALADAGQADRDRRKKKHKG